MQVSLQYFKKEVGSEVDFLVADEHKGYLHCKMINSQNVSSESQIKNFFIS